MPRPHINKLTKELMVAVDEASGDADELSTLIHEIEFRKKAKVKLAPTLQKAKQMREKAELESRKVYHQPRTFEVEQSTPSKPSVSFIPKNESKETPPPLSPKENIVTSGEFKPWFGASLIGKPATHIRLKGEVLEIHHRDRKERIELKSITSSKVTMGLFSLALTIEGSPGQLARIGGISRGSVDGLNRLILSCRFGEELQSAFLEFEAMLGKSNYLNRRPVINWAEQYQKAFDAAKEFGEKRVGSNDLISKWVNLASNWSLKVDQRNTEYVLRKSEECLDYFNKLETNPLTTSQVESILRDEDHTLVVAGAGTGKTSVVIGKIAYLIDSGEVKPDEVLALAFGKKAADEMRNRIAERTGHKVEISTFHALGLKIAGDVEDERLVISDVATDKGGRAMHALLARLLSEMFVHRDTKEAVLNFVSYHRYPARYLEDFDHNGNYLQYMRKHEPRTLKGELVKSFEELLIADWLTLHGVEYEYEYPYEHDTASRKKRQYKPDFFLTESRIYLEHFGIDKNGETAPGIDKKKYAEGMTWKRNLHSKQGTKLIETYSWERQRGVLLDGLKTKLTEAGVRVGTISENQIKKLMDQREINDKLVSLLRDFLNVFKEGQWTFEEINEHISSFKGPDLKRSLSFMKVFRPLYERYESYLAERREIDFSDLIRKATEYLDTGASVKQFRRIIVDEYQDISRGRHRLLKKLLEQTEDTRIMCVGDDWQSIYGFTGSDIRMTTAFESLFGFTARVDLDQTFRFTQPILESSSRFVQCNPTQLNKSIKARVPVLERSIEIHIAEAGKTVELQKILKEIESERPKRQRWSVMLLGRYNFTAPKSWKEDAKQFKMLDIDYLTIHKSKGLEADVVVVLGLSSGRYGFPGEIPNDPLMSLVLPAEEEFPRAEERRVLYVAMTRAKEKVVLVANESNSSEFIDELKEHPEVILAEGQTESHNSYICGLCGKGKLELAHPNRVNGYAWKCSLKPYCSGEAKLCSHCKKSPLRQDDFNVECMKPGCRERRGRW